MQTTPEHDSRDDDAPTCLMTTLYDLMTVLQGVVEPHEDALVVALVARWLQTGRITLLDRTAAHRRRQRRAAMALCRWSFQPPMTQHRLPERPSDAALSSLPVGLLETLRHAIPSA